MDRDAKGVEIKTDVDVITDADCITMDDGDLRSGVKKMIDDRIGEVIDGAPAELDTLKEIATELEKNQSGVSTILNQMNNKIEKAAITDDYTISRSDIIPSTKALSDGLRGYEELLREKASLKELELYAKDVSLKSLSSRVKVLDGSVRKKADKTDIVDFKRCIVISGSDYAALSDAEKNRADTLYFLM